MNLHHTGPSPPQLLIPFDPLLGIHKKPSWNCSQSRLASLTGTDHHASVKLSLGTFTPWLSAFALQFIDRPFDDRPIGKEGLNKPSHLIEELNQGAAKTREFSFCCFLIEELNQGAAKTREFSFCCFSLYAHIYISIQIITQKSRKK